MKTKPFTPTAPDGKPMAPIDAIKIRHYVDGIAFNFAVHYKMNRLPGYAVSHWESGAKVCDIPLTVSIFETNKKRAAIQAIDDLVKQYPAGRVSSVINAALARAAR